MNLDYIYRVLSPTLADKAPKNKSHQATQFSSLMTLDYVYIILSPTSVDKEPLLSLVIY